MVVRSYGNNHDNNRDRLSRLVNGKDLVIRTARNDLSAMAEKGLVKKVGTGDRNTAYVLAEI